MVVVDTGEFILEDRYLLDSLPSQTLAVLNEHPHDALDLGGRKQSFALICVRLERQFLLPQGHFVPAGQGFSVIMEDVLDYLLRFRSLDRRDEDVL